jgi:hypothetical protein
MEEAMRLVSALAFTLLVVGCADKGDEGFFILNNTAPPVGATACTLTGDAGQPFIAAGAISYLSPSGYVFTPLLESRITAVMGSEAERTIHLEGANVTLTAPASGGTTSFTALFSGSLAPNNGTTNVSFELLPKASIMMLGSMTANSEVVASVTPYGTLGGGRIDGEPFQYPITIVAPANGILTSQGSCASASLPAASTTVNPCNPYQDGVIDCCTCTSKTSPPTMTTVCPSEPDTINCM